MCKRISMHIFIYFYYKNKIEKKMFEIIHLFFLLAGFKMQTFVNVCE